MWKGMFFKPMGGPMKLEIPWNNNNKPKASVSLSKPIKSTSITEVKPTYAPVIFDRLIDAYIYGLILLVIFTNQL